MLKWFACLCMLIDHIGYYFQDYMPYEVYVLLRCVGRLAFPIFAWSVAMGCRRTRNLFRYFVRMSIFAAVTEVIFIFAHRWAGLSPFGRNVLITFSLSIVMIAGFRMAFHSTKDMIASLRPVSPTPTTMPCATRYDVRINIGGIEMDSRAGLLIGVVMMAAAVIATVRLAPDYDLYGLLSILLFYVVHDCLPEKSHAKWSILGFAVINVVFSGLRILSGEGVTGAIIQCLSILALPLCYAAVGEKKPAAWVKYAFYVFYPLHITALLLVHALIAPG